MQHPDPDDNEDIGKEKMISRDCCDDGGDSEEPMG
jgi:hypothetical protein